MPSWPRLFDLVSTSVAIRNEPLLTLGKRIMELVPAPARLLEVGCGSGILSGYFSDFGYKVVAVDKDPAVLAYAKRRLTDEMLGMPLLLERDAFTIAESLAEYAPFALSWSAGLLEHFQDDQIVEILRQQLLVASLVIFSVPGIEYPRFEFGDERHLSQEYWFSLCEQLKNKAEATVSMYGNGLHVMGILTRRDGK